MRWRDKKGGRPGFVFHPWMQTVDDLEDENDRLREVLTDMRGWMERRGYSVAKIDAALRPEMTDAASHGDGDVS